MSTQQSFAGIPQILDFAIGREQEARRSYLAYAQSTNRKGFRQLLLTMADMEAEHEQKLLELRRRVVQASEVALSDVRLVKEAIQAGEPFCRILK